MTEFIFNQIFKGHQWLWIADSFSRYEREQDNLRANPSEASFDQESYHSDRFRFLLPMVLSNADLDVEFRCQHDEVLLRLAEIENTFNVFRRSIDFDVSLGNSLKRVLAKPRKPGPRRDLLSKEQFAHVADVISSIDQWEGNLESAGDVGSLWTTLYRAQCEIYETGHVSLDSRVALNSLNTAKPNRKRTYARPLLTLLLAEFFDDFSGTDVATNISDCSVAEEYDAKTEKVVKEARAYFDSPFARFVVHFHELVDLGDSLTPNSKLKSSFDTKAKAKAEEVASRWDDGRPNRQTAMAHFAEKAEFDRQACEWRIDQRHENLGFERSILNARKSKRTPRISEMIINGSSLANVSEVLSILDVVKPPKEKSK